MSLPICEHIKLSGARCGSPAISHQQYCYHHASVHRLVPNNNLFVPLFNPRCESDPYYQYEFPYMDDPVAIQIGFMQVIHGVSQQRIEQRRAKLILSALHGAAANLRQLNAATTQCERPPKKGSASVKVEETKAQKNAR